MKAQLGRDVSRHRRRAEGDRREGRDGLRSHRPRGHADHPAEEAGRRLRDALRQHSASSPETTPIDPEGVKAPAPGAGPYYVAEFVLERASSCWSGTPSTGAPDQPTSTASSPTSPWALDGARMLDRVDRGELDWAGVNNASYADRAERVPPQVRDQQGRASSPCRTETCGCSSSTRAEPLFRKNSELRQAVNFAVDRKALLRERGPLAGTLTDQYLPPGMPGFRDERIYPLKGPDLKKARAAREGPHAERQGGALHASRTPVGVAQAQIVKEQPAGRSARGRDQGVSSGRSSSASWRRRESRSTSAGIGLGSASTTPPGSTASSTAGRSASPAPSTTRTSTRRSTTGCSTRPRGFRWDPSATDATGSSTSTSRGTRRRRSRSPTTGRSRSLSPRTGCVVINPYLDLTAVCLK